ncbi:MAG TPA: hypothetical protein VKQ27_13595 [Acetobacteraceae bacterium]|nr:hypothetical protein [Acetobacteraceae bacterium]
MTIDFGAVLGGLSAVTSICAATLSFRAPAATKGIGLLTVLAGLLALSAAGWAQLHQPVKPWLYGASG